MQDEALLDALAHTLEAIKPGKFGDTLADVQGIAHTITVENGHTCSYTG